jgi:hypothetical protein
MQYLDWPAICGARAAGVGSIRCPLDGIGCSILAPAVSDGRYSLPDTDRCRVGDTQPSKKKTPWAGSTHGRFLALSRQAGDGILKRLPSDR